jgi:hypothetical protein
MTSQIGYVSLASPPSATNAGSDTALTFAEIVTQVTVQNNTASIVNIAFDATASAGSFAIPAGATLVEEKQCSVLHLYTASAQNINGTSANNIVVLGEV